MESDPRVMVNPINIETVVRRSVGVLTGEDFPEKVILKIQVVAPDETDARTLLLHFGSKRRAA